MYTYVYLYIYGNRSCVNDTTSIYTYVYTYICVYVYTWKPFTHIHTPIIIAGLKVLRQYMRWPMISRLPKSTRLFCRT